MNNRLAPIFFAIVCFSISLVGQVVPKRTPVLTRSAEYDSSLDFAVSDVRGTVKNKAVCLVKPEYPFEARWLGTEGEVRVQISIDD